VNRRVFIEDCQEIRKLAPTTVGVARPDYPDGSAVELHLSVSQSGAELSELRIKY
jgi:hypothetical protein